MFSHQGFVFDENLCKYSKDKDIFLPPIYCQMFKQPKNADVVGTLNIHLPNGNIVDITYGRDETGARLREKIKILGVEDVQNYMIISPKGFIDDSTDIESMQLPNKSEIILQKNKFKPTKPTYLKQVYQRRNSLPRPQKMDGVRFAKSELKFTPHKFGLPRKMQTFADTGRNIF